MKTNRLHQPFFSLPAFILTSLCICFLIAGFVFPRPCGAAEPPSPGASQPAGKDEKKQPPSPTLWSFAWVSDMHMNASKVRYMARAMRHIDTKLKPRFVMFTGDNNYNPAEPKDKNESKELRRQRFFKQFLNKYLKTPWVVIPGDDWPQEFDKVFGPKQYSFDYGGIHFLFLAPDRVYHGHNLEGLSVFDKPAWTWIRRDLKKSRNQPTIVVIHEPIYPMTFLDAPPLRRLLAGYPNVFAVLQGHLHTDLEYHVDGKTYLVAPALGEPPTPGMKLVDVTPTGLVVRTILYNKKTDRFEMQPRRQIVEIPEALRRNVTKPKTAKFVKADYDAVPAKPLMTDPSLEKRKGELLQNALKTLLTTGKSRSR